MKELIGKTIVDAKVKRAKGYDNSGYLELTFSDGTTKLIVSAHGGYTGGSIPAFLRLEDNVEEELEDIYEQTN